MNLRDFCRLLRAQLDAEGCTCDPAVKFNFKADTVVVGHDEDCPRRDMPDSLLRVDELRKEPS